MVVLKLFLLVAILWFGRGGGDVGDCDSATPNKKCALRLADQDILKEYDAIRKVHMHLDDDHDGSVDTRESAEFIKEELKDENGSKHKKFHHEHEDEQISVKDVWAEWYKSKVYNWTVDEVIYWLEDVVALPQYSEKFRELRILGKDLPRIAINSGGVIQFDLGINDVSHKKKLGLRAMDVVLFGLPKVPYKWWKDAVLATLGLCSVVFVIFALRDRKMNKIKTEQLKALMKTAEDNLATLQQRITERDSEIESAREEASKCDEAIEETEMERSDSRNTDDSVSVFGSMDEAYSKHLRAQISQLQNEKVHLLEQLNRQEDTNQKLQQLLTDTYLKEHSHWEHRRTTVEKQLSDAKKQCEKIYKRKSTILGSLRIVNSPAFHDADLNINRALVALKEVMDNLDEYKQRWRAIESLTGLRVVSTQVQVKKQTVMVEPGSSQTTVIYEQASAYNDSNLIDVEDDNLETSSQFSGYSMASTKAATLPAHRASSKSLDHQPVTKQDRSILQKSSSDGKLHSSGNQFKSSLFSRVGVYEKIEEDDGITFQQDPESAKDSPNYKRKIFKKSKGN